jgi:hypothetical protein
VFTWNHNPVDGSAQTKYSIQYRVVGGAYPGTPQVNEVSSTSSSHTFSSGTFTNGTQYEYQVKTWGAYTSGSAWSTTGTFRASAIPECVITVPGLSAYGFSALNLEWTYTQAQGVAQREFYTALYQNGTLLESTTQTLVVTNGNTGEYAFDYVLLNNNTYTVELQVKDTDYQLSAIESIEFTTSFLAPETPTLELSVDYDHGSVVIEITNPAFTPGVTVDTVYNDLYRLNENGDYVPILTGIPPNTTVTDYIPNLIGELSYFVYANSDVPSASNSAIHNITLNLRGYYYINGGDSYETAVKFISDVSANSTSDVDENLVQYHGRTYPIRYKGQFLSETIDFTGDLLFEEYENMLAIIKSDDNIYYRDWKGRQFACKLENNKFDHKDQVAYQYSCRIVRIEV